MNASARTMERPLRWPLANQQANRSESFDKDARIVNAFVEQDPNTGEWIVQKRVGYTLDYHVTAPWANGIYAWAPPGAQTSVWSISTTPGPGPGPFATAYKDGAVFGTAGTLDGQSPGINYSFVQDQALPASPGTRHLVAVSNSSLYYTTGTGGFTKAVLPTSMKLYGAAYLDQSIYVMDALGQIWNSAFNDPSTWPGSQVTANAIAGQPVQLTQQLNYVIALKTNSMEVFYDAANQSPASPLSPVSGALSNYGALPGTVQTIDDLVFWATSNYTVSPQVIRLDNLQISIISIPAVERMLDQVPIQGVQMNSWTFKHGGHRFYGLTLQGYVGSVLPSFTLIYDIDQKQWYRWTDSLGNFWPVNGMAYDANSKHVLQGMLDGGVYLFEGDYEYPTDNGVVAPVEIYTPNADFGTSRRKTLHQMYFEADQTPGSVIYVRRSDDDYQTWSIPRRVDLGKKKPRMRNEGTFTRRAYHIKHVSPTPFRIRSGDLQMDFGVI